MRINDTKQAEEVFETMILKIEQFIKSKPRHRLVLSKNYADRCQYVDLGQALSRVLSEDFPTPSIVMKTDDALQDILNSNTLIHSLFGKYIAIDNIAILFEPELRINVKTLIDNWSKSQLVIVKYEGLIEDNYLWLTVPNDHIGVDLKGLSYLLF